MRSKRNTAILILLAAFCLFLLPVTARAADTTVTENDYEFTITDGVAVLTAYTGSESTLTLPTTVTAEGTTYKVRTVCAGALDGNQTVKELTIPNGITAIEPGAFDNCVNLTSITIKAEIGDIDTEAGSKPVFYNAGANSDSLTVTFGSGVTSVPAGLFATTSSQSEGKYAHITSVTLPSSVTQVGDYAFCNCYDLTDVTLSKNLSSIGAYAFANNAFTTLTFPGGAPTMDETSFDGVKAKVYYPSPHPTWTSDVRTDYGGTLTWKSQFTSASQMTIKSISNTTSGVKLKWSKVSSASGYYLYRKPAGGTYALLETITDNTTVSYTDTTAAGGTKYAYCIKAFNDTVTSRKSAGAVIRYLEAVSIDSLTNTAKGIKLTWPRVTGCTGYYIYRKSTGTYRKIATIAHGTTLHYTDTAVQSKNGITYRYAIKAKSGCYSGSYVSSIFVRLPTPTLSSVTNSAAGKLTVKWKKKSSATGYQIQYSTSDSFASAKTSTKTISGASNVSKVISGLTKGKTYYVRLRTYKKVDGKTYYSAWTGQKNRKISK